MRLHTGNLFQCDLCGLKYNTKYMLQFHKEKKHGLSISNWGWVYQYVRERGEAVVNDNGFTVACSAGLTLVVFFLIYIYVNMHSLISGLMSAFDLF